MGITTSTEITIIELEPSAAVGRRPGRTEDGWTTQAEVQQYGGLPTTDFVLGSVQRLPVRGPAAFRAEPLSGACGIASRHSSCGLAAEAPGGARSRRRQTP